MLSGHDLHCGLGGTSRSLVDAATSADQAATSANEKPHCNTSEYPEAVQAIGPTFTGHILDDPSSNPRYTELALDSVATDSQLNHSAIDDPLAERLGAKSNRDSAGSIAARCSTLNLAGQRRSYHGSVQPT